MYMKMMFAEYCWDFESFFCRFIVTECLLTNNSIVIAAKPSQKFHIFSICNHGDENIVSCMAGLLDVHDSAKELPPTRSRFAVAVYSAVSHSVQ